MRIILKPMGALALLGIFVLITGVMIFEMMKPKAPAIPATANGSPSASGSPETFEIHPIRLDPRSVVQNASFEEMEGGKNPARWNVDLAGNNAVNVAYLESLRGPHSGHLELTHYGGSDYDVRTTQKLTGLKNGKYTLQAWFRNNVSTGNRDETYLVAKDFGTGETRKDKLVPRCDDWTQVKVTDVPVTNGQCMIGIYSKAQGGAWTQVDDVEFIPQD